MSQVKNSISVLLENTEGMKENSKIQKEKLLDSGLEVPAESEDDREKNINNREQKAINKATDESDYVKVHDIKHTAAGTLSSKTLSIDKNDKLATSGNAATVLNNKMDELAKKPYNFAQSSEPNKNWDIQNKKMDILAKKPYKDDTTYA